MYRTHTHTHTQGNIYTEFTLKAVTTTMDALATMEDNNDRESPTMRLLESLDTLNNSASDLLDRYHLSGPFALSSEVF